MERSGITGARGFGFIEFAVVIIILGVLFLLTLKGTALIPFFRTYVTAQQINQYQAAVLQYQTDYANLPGDDAGAPARWNRVDAIYLMGGVVVSYVGDGKISGFLDDPGNATGEQYMAWRDLRLSGLAAGDAALVGESARPENPNGGTYGFAEDNLGLQQVLCLTKVPGADAGLLDTRLDDGVISTGRLRGTSQWDPFAAKNHFPTPDTQPYDPEKTYIICLPMLP